jgi:hypothetical protein
MKNSKQLMYQISSTMSRPEAIGFARTLESYGKYYLVKVSENPKSKTFIEAGVVCSHTLSTRKRDCEWLFCVVCGYAAIVLC